MLKSIWSYRQFITSAIKNDLVTRFARSRIGGTWMIIHPLVQVAIYALILSAVLSAKLPGMDNQFAYAIYLTSGMLAWSLFSEVVNRSLTLFIENGNLMKKMVFPKITLPVIVIGSALVNNLLLFVAIMIIFFLLGHVPTLAILWLPLIMCILLLFSVAIGLILGILNVFLRDIGQIVPIILQVGFWLTPIVYPLQIVPDYLQNMLQANPLYPIVSAYQSILVYGQPPEAVLPLVYIVMISVLLMLFGLLLFRRASPEMVDVL